ncbi:MAG: hypothetical protein KF741_13865 [Ferruginibacter sp.]|nr:hypothetical protein [Bacteroidota bacterium]MBX2920320.1 hypothetical protein [Ferruginibacter sp.]
MSTIISAAIIIAVLILITWLFIVIHKNNQEKKAAGLRVQFNELAFKNNLVITDTEIMHNQLFGIDELYSKMLVVKTTGKNRYRHRIVFLDDVIACTLQKNTRAVYEKGNTEKITEVIVEQVSLLFNIQTNENLLNWFFIRMIPITFLNCLSCKLRQKTGVSIFLKK